ncbi:hypothetical protein ACLOJK_037533 [Asimina triloba]
MKIGLSEEACEGKGSCALVKRPSEASKGEESPPSKKRRLVKGNIIDLVLEVGARGVEGALLIGGKQVEEDDEVEEVQLQMLRRKRYHWLWLFAKAWLNLYREQCLQFQRLVGRGEDPSGAREVPIKGTMAQSPKKIAKGLKRKGRFQLVRLLKG